jgi:hypothetical protein
MANGNHLVVEYVDMPPAKRKVWLQGLVALYAYAESLDVDQLNHQRAAGVHGCEGKHQDTHVHACAVSEISSSNKNL